MKPIRILFVALTIAFLSLSSTAAAQSATAGAATPTDTLTPAPLLKKAPAMEVQLWPDAGSSAILVSATVPTGTALPVRVRLPLPTGARVDWVGEIMGDAPDKDITSRFRLVEDGSVVEMVLTTSRVAQYEATYLVPLKRKGAYLCEFEWVQTVPASSVAFTVGAPVVIDDVTVTPASKYAPQIDESGDRLYLLSEQKMAVGDKKAISVVYHGPGADGSETGGSSTASTVLISLLAVLAVAVVALVLVVWRQRSARRRG